MTQAFRVEGDFQMGRIRQHFSVEAIGSDEDQAREAVMADLGSRHGVPRRQIDIKSVSTLSKDEMDGITQKKLE